MKKTKKLLKDILLLRAPEHLYIIIMIVKVGAFIVGALTGYYIHERIN